MAIRKNRILTVNALGTISVLRKAHFKGQNSICQVSNYSRQAGFVLMKN